MTRRRGQVRGDLYLEQCTQVRVRFQEVDSLQVVWHGHYLSYFEEGRTAFGREFGFHYTDILEAGFVAPLVHIEIDYFAPARFGDILEVRTRLYPSEAARISFDYLVLDASGGRLASGSSEQVFTDRKGDLILVRPAFVDRFLARHEGKLIRA